ncbi:MAG: DNA mismatch repair protein MutS [Calditrichales bacterium]|nr:MAG: DNA mismatch repair protein MutS [Calditrichales bacterium]
MEQYLKIKAEYQDTILLYRMGDFYETFYDDAKTISKVLGIALTKRAHGKSAEVPLAGFPYHALDNYLHKLVRVGHRVAICEQVEDPRLAKGVVKREVIEIVTPGATLSDKLLDHKKNNFLAALYFSDESIGLALSDISTGEFYAAEIATGQLIEQIIAFQPKEIIVPAGQHELIHDYLENRLQVILTKRDDWMFSRDYAYELLVNHFDAHSLKGFGIEDMPAAISSAGAVINYLQENYKSSLGHIRSVQVINLSEYMVLDDATRRNLEIKDPLQENVDGKTLLQVIDQTRTPMGGRLLRKWINQPLRIAATIAYRQDLVEALFLNTQRREMLQKTLAGCSDMERLIGKVATGRANARDLVNLKTSLQIIPEVKRILDDPDLVKLKKIASEFDILAPVVNLIEKAIMDDPPQTIKEGGVIRPGYSEDLDELTQISTHGKEWLAAQQRQERERTGIPTLKISFNKVFGYYIEVTKANVDKIPLDYIRKQTLVNAERYITPELKEMEEKILGAEEKIHDLEYDLFQEVREATAKETAAIQNNSMMLAILDCVGGFAEVAVDNHYIRPKLSEDKKLWIKKGRHPVVEKFLRPGEEFVPNDTRLEPGDEQIWIITGPNMAGKSTFLRQVGLIVFMAQIGCFVPAETAEIGLVDRIFTRVGASDNLARGESTFLIEMNETANILNNATDQSLVLLDEIGRGTSTFDGLAIAWAVSEYLHNQENRQAKTLFATHYHELTELALLYPNIKNYNVAVEEWENKVIFLRKIIPGGTDNSYGIHVAQMAGLPRTVIERAREILVNLEANELSPNRTPKLAKRHAGRDVDHNQLSLFTPAKPSPVELELKGMNLDRMTPLEALLKLSELKKMLGD